MKNLGFFLRFFCESGPRSAFRHTICLGSRVFTVGELVSACDRELWPVALTFEPDRDSVKPVWQIYRSKIKDHVWLSNCCQIELCTASVYLQQPTTKSDALCVRVTWRLKRCYVVRIYPKHFERVIWVPRSFFPGTVYCSSKCHTNDHQRSAARSVNTSSM